MPVATSTPTTAPAPTAPPAPAGLRLQLDPTMAGTGAVDGGWWPRSRDPDAELPGLIAAHTIGVTRAFQDRAVLLVVPPQASTADAANSTGPADILAAARAGGEDPAPMPPPSLR
jgi:hypothetical protein